ncbi:major facilitator superfamily sugar transporter [Streptococcus varani]|uniref:Major facilitator superfamily sugar transporter n=1 Tax=Streptococcus varani TaxID=1608583 RepID=A0A0E4CRN9_9STRE|nr:MFS transporter [Streptococcus varani]CQR23717.1 major facilitator superfamily sugar transporter [Streptococcus varani]
MMKKEKIGFAGLQLLAYITFSLCMSNFIPYMAQMGYSSLERSYALSAYAVLTILLQLFFGFLSNAFQTSKWISLVSLFLLGFFASLLFGLNQDSLVLVVLLVGFCGGLVNSLCSLIDTWIMGVNLTMAENLSRLKVFGSIGWTLGSLSSTLLINYFGFKGITLAVLTFTLGILSFSRRLPDSCHQRRKDPETVSAVNLIKNKPYLFLVFILFLLYGLVVANTGIVVDKMLALEASQFEISLKWAMGSLLEIPMYFYSMKLIHKYGNQHLLLLSSAIFVLQFLGFSLAQGSLYIVLFSSLQALTTPIILITSKFLIAELVPVNLQSSSQMIAMSIYMGGSSLLTPLISGYLGSWLGFNLTLALYAFLALVIFISLYLWIQFKPRLQENDC